jgi:hypothetical protein
MSEEHLDLFVLDTRRCRHRSWRSHGRALKSLAYGGGRHLDSYESVGREGVLQTYR